MSVLVETSLGVFVLDLYTKERPKCSFNFIKLCCMKAYNFCVFHSVQKNLVAQTGDPSGTGRGGSSIFEYLYGSQAKFFESEKKPKISHSKRGLVSMVDNGYGQHGSQFFITLADGLEYLDDKHTVFGQIAEGFDFLDNINEVYCDEENRPFRNVRIRHTIILDDPFPSPADLDFPDSPTRVPLSQFIDIGPPRIEEDEALEETVCSSPTQLVELKAEQEAKTHAQLLTLIGDLPDADVKPPDNVLFVCRLNPVTTAEDLEIIFSRFGPIKSCEVIRDRRTGASLQYAFIEFENDSDCESAFFKMDKVVIDDRRIHVDFSQSVAKEWKKYKQQQQQQQQQVPRTSQESSRLHNRKRTFPTQSDRYHRAPRSRTRSRSAELPRGSRAKHVKATNKRHSSRSSSDDRDEDRRGRSMLPGADLDLVISDSDENASHSTSGSPSRKRRHRKLKPHLHPKDSHHKKHHKSKHKKVKKSEYPRNRH
ncbi:unnamed protein product [Dicrocoelium dendriticum]|nr:unnamed protein product [Dicrocoelium dendriticum]